MTTTKSKIVQLDMPPPTLDELSKMLSRAFSLGQTYWQQADSESYSQNRKSDATLEKFRAMQDGFLPAIVAYGDARAAAAALAERGRCAKLLERTGNDHCAAAIRVEPKEQQP